MFQNIYTRTKNRKTGVRKETKRVWEEKNSL
jgi:hypothetical protein